MISPACETFSNAFEMSKNIPHTFFRHTLPRQSFANFLSHQHQIVSSSSFISKTRLKVRQDITTFQKRIQAVFNHSFNQLSHTTK
jgi:hypothetical protein